MRFVDASVFIYAYLKPKGVLPTEIREVKENAKSIVKRINAGERVVTTLIHLSEVANVLEVKMPLETSLEVLSSLISLNNMEVTVPTTKDYMVALEEARSFKVGVNDALAYTIMRETGLREVYSFDRHFDLLPDITRITR